MITIFWWFLPYISKSVTGLHVFPPILNPPLPTSPPHPIPLYCPRAPALGALPHTVNLHWPSVLHKVIYMFQYYSLKSSHPHLKCGF